MLMTTLNLLGLMALGFLLFLLILVLFQPGLYYQVPQPVHDLDDNQRLRLLAELLRTRVRQASHIQHFNQGSDFYAAQLTAIAGATQSLHLENYIFKPGPIADKFIAALEERAQAGVQVRIVVDAIGSRHLRSKLLRNMRAAGIDIHRYHFLQWHSLIRLNNRTHRNLLLVDGKLAFIGGAGIADYWDRPGVAWRDTVLCCEGEVVASLQGVFAENWLECTGQLLAGAACFPAPSQQATDACQALAVGSTPTYGRSNQARVLVQFLLASAREEILICSPYFIPDKGIRHELLQAQARGVKVRIITGGPYTDHHLVRRAGRKRFGHLLKAGIEVYEYANAMLHAKVLLVDGRWCLLGSTNFDHRSFGINDAVNLLLLNPALYEKLATDFQQDLSHSQAFTLSDWQRRSVGERLLAWLGTALERHQ